MGKGLPQSSSLTLSHESKPQRSEDRVALATASQVKPKGHVNMRSAHLPHNRVRKSFSLASRTHQSFVDETDVNKIMAKYQKTGLIDHVNTYGGQYAEMPKLNDFTDCMNTVTSANSMFADLPATVRDRFQNDPGQFLDFLSDDKNRADLIEMGLIPPAEDVEEETTPPEDPPPPEPPEPLPAAS